MERIQRGFLQCLYLRVPVLWTKEFLAGGNDGVRREGSEFFRLVNARPHGNDAAANLAGGMARSVGFFEPPPETISSRYRVPGLMTKRRMACAIDCAVSAVAVARMSGLAARPHRLRKFATNSRPNSSRPAVFGGRWRKNGAASNARTTS